MYTVCARTNQYVELLPLLSSLSLPLSHCPCMYWLDRTKQSLLANCSCETKLFFTSFRNGGDLGKACTLREEEVDPAFFRQRFKPGGVVQL